jgi:hypothetical protein
LITEDAKAVVPVRPEVFQSIKVVATDIRGTNPVDGYE